MIITLCLTNFEVSTVLYSSMMVGMHGCVPSHVAANEAEYIMDFVSRIRHSAVTLYNHLILSVAHLDNFPRLYPPNHAQVHLQAKLESPSHVHPCAQVVTSPGLNSLCQMHPPAQMDSSHGT